jgi:hypothetical protein
MIYESVNLHLAVAIAKRERADIQSILEVKPLKSRREKLRDCRPRNYFSKEHWKPRQSGCHRGYHLRQPVFQPTFSIRRTAMKETYGVIWV